MQYITEWVRNIVVFLLLATMIHLLVPHSNLQKYVKFVVSLMLIVLILTPFFTLLQTDVPKAIGNLYKQKELDDKKIENTINVKKKEIQASQRAYILEQMAVQMKNDVSKKLESEYGLQIVNLDITIGKDKQEVSSQQDIEAVTVSFDKVDGRRPTTIETVKKVDISSPESITDKQTEVQQFLAKEWQVDQSKIKVGEGRAGKTYEQQ